MRDDDCVKFLQWALPRLGLRWPGFRKVRRQVCRRIARRMAVLGVASLDAYRERLAVVPSEWAGLERSCRVTISRFWRDRATFEALEGRVLPKLAARAAASGRTVVDAWSAGAASGEEAYTLSILWRDRIERLWPGMRLRILASDIDLHCLARLLRGVYPEGSVRELPEALAEAALERGPEGFRVADRYRAAVHPIVHDLRSGAPGGPFDLVLCRNLAFTYFDGDGQRAVLAGLLRALRFGGGLVVGRREEPPGADVALETAPELEAWVEEAGIWRRG